MADLWAPVAFNPSPKISNWVPEPSIPKPVRVQISTKPHYPVHHYSSTCAVGHNDRNLRSAGHGSNTRWNPMQSHITIANRGNRHLGINRHELPFPLFPAPVADHRHRCFSLTLVHLSCSSRHLIAKSCLSMQTFPSVYPVFDSPCMNWTVYWTLMLCRLPTLIQPALLSDYPECSPPAWSFTRTLTLILLYLLCNWSTW